MSLEAIVMNGGSQTSLQVLRCLSSAGVRCAVADDRPGHGLLAPSSRYCERFLHYRRVDDLVEAAPSAKDAAIICCDDRSVLAVASRREFLSRYFGIPFPNYDTLMRAMDKSLAYELCKRTSVPAPMTLVPAGSDEIRRISRQLAYPVLVKPRLTIGFIPIHGKKLYFCRNAQELLSAYTKVHRTHPNPLIQEVIPGGDDQVYSLIVLLGRTGRCLGSFCFRKIAQWPPNYGVGCLCVSVHMPILVGKSLALLRRLGWRGIASIEYKYDARDNMYKLLDVNPRPCMQTNLAFRAGINFPKALFDMAHGEEKRLGDYRDGIFWVEGRSLLRNLKVRLRRNLRLSEAARLLFRLADPHTTRSILSIRDPGPASIQAIEMLEGVSKSIGL